MSIANATLRYINDEARATYDHGGPAPAEAPRHFTMMSDEAVERVALLGMAALGMYTYLERRANTEGIVIVSRGTLADVFGVTTDRVKQVLKTLRDAGVIEATVRHSERSGLQLENAYFLPLHQTKNPSNSRGVAGSNEKHEQLQGGSRVNANDSRGVGQGVGGGVASRAGQEGSKYEVDKEVVKSPPHKPKTASAKKTRMTEDYALTDDQVAEAQLKHGLTREQVDREFEKFRDYYIAKGEARASWPASWRNWLRNREQYQRPTNGYQTKEDKRQKTLDYFMKRAQEAP